MADALHAFSQRPHDFVSLLGQLIGPSGRSGGEVSAAFGDELLQPSMVDRHRSVSLHQLFWQAERVSHRDGPSLLDV